jgi:predicted aconitase with swiveling domain
MSKKGTAPLAIINVETEGIIAAGCILAEIPLIDMLDKNPINAIENGDFVQVDGKKGKVIIKKKED